MPLAANQDRATIETSGNSETGLLVACARAIALETARRAALSAQNLSQGERIAAIVRGELPEPNGRRMSPLD